MIKFACHSANFREMSLAEALGTIARLGFSYVDMDTAHHLPLSELSNRRKIIEVRDLLSLYNLQISDVYMTLKDITAEDRYQRQNATDAFKGILPFIKAIEAKGITIALGQIDDESESEILASSLETLRNHAEQAELALSIEARVDTAIDTPQDLRTILSRIRGLDLTLDWAHMVYRGASNSIADLLPKTRHIHLRQAKPYSLQIPFVDGDIVPEKMLAMLQNAEYSGFISLWILPYAERHHIADINPILGVLNLRDALREAGRSSHEPN